MSDTAVGKFDASKSSATQGASDSSVVLGAVILPCPFCGSRAEVVHASHIRCINWYNCDGETRLGTKAWNRRAPNMELRGAQDD